MDANQTFFPPAYEPLFPAFSKTGMAQLRAGVAFQTGNRWLGSEEEEEGKRTTGLDQIAPPLSQLPISSLHLILSAF